MFYKTVLKFLFVFGIGLCMFSCGQDNGGTEDEPPVQVPPVTSPEPQSPRKLGIAYTKATISDALATEPNIIDWGAGYELVGLAFSKNATQKDFRVDAIFYKEQGLQFRSEKISLGNLNEHYFLFSHGEEYLIKPISESHPDLVLPDFDINAATTIPSSIRDKEASELPTADYEFWNNNVDFVLFSKFQLETLLSHDAKAIMISGTKTNFGAGKRDFQNTRNPEMGSTYPTLKAETSNGQVNVNVNYPLVLVGAPCPPYWGSLEALYHMRIYSQKALPKWRAFCIEFSKDTLNKPNVPAL